MTYTAGIDVGSTYTKAVIIDEGRELVAMAMNPTGFKLTEIAEITYQEAVDSAGIFLDDVSYVVDVQVTDLTAAARGAAHLFPGTRTILDVGGQTMKASRISDHAKVESFRLNDKCAAGTGAFLEKTARYMGYSTEEIGPLVVTSKDATEISGVCAVFAESEVINQLSLGTPPADIMHGAIVSLVGRSIQLMKRVRDRRGSQRAPGPGQRAAGRPGPVYGRFRCRHSGAPKVGEARHRRSGRCGRGVMVDSGHGGPDPRQRVDRLGIVVEAEARRMLSQEQFEPDPRLVSQGWQRRFMADGLRAREAMPMRSPTNVVTVSC